MAAHKTNFGLKLIIIFLSCLLLFTGVLIFLWSFLGEYEKTNPKNCINEYIELLKTSNYEKAMELSGLEKTEYFGQSEYERFMKESLGGFDNLEIYEILSQNPEERTFELKGEGGIKIFLMKDTNGYKYGFSGYKMRQEEVEKYSYTINLPDGYVPMLNGNELKESNIVGEKTPVLSFSSLNDKSKIPTMVTYKVDGLVFEPEITLSGIDKENYSCNKTKDNEVTITAFPDKNNIKAYEQLAVDAGIMYSKYIFKDATFNEVSKYFYAETSCYKLIKEYSNAWTVPHHPPKFENIKAKNTIQFSDGYYQTEIYFDHIITNIKKIKNQSERVYHTGYRVSFIKIGNSFKVANLEVI